MGVSCTVVTGTYGASSWQHLARTRAWPSVVAEGVPWIHIHGETLHEARNAALEQVETEWVIHLDADDALEQGYVEAMAGGTADVRAPLARFVGERGRERMWRPHVAGHRHECEAACLPEGNWIVVGAMVRTELVREVGGWRDFPLSEDWDLWLRCHLAGASFEWCPDAVYRAWARPDSRNRAPDRAAELAAYSAIYEANFPAAAA